MEFLHNSKKYIFREITRDFKNHQKHQVKDTTDISNDNSCKTI